MNLVQYIKEALSAGKTISTESSKWLANVYESMQKLVKDGKVDPVDVDVEKLAKPDNAFNFKNFINDKSMKALIANQQFGFTITNQAARSLDKYFTDSDSLQCLPYWYRLEDSNNANAGKEQPTYFVGLTVFSSTTYVKGFLSLEMLDVSNCVKAELPVLKAMLNDFGLHYANKLGNWSGLAASPTNPKIRATFIRLGFSPLQDDKNILTYKL